MRFLGFKPRVTYDYVSAVQRGKIKGHSIMVAFGERKNIGTTTSGEDIWPGSDAEIPVIPSSGEQLEIVSTSAQDGIAGTGIKELKIHYLNEDGTEASEIIIMNGITPVVMDYATVRHIQYMNSTGGNQGSVADGDITIYKQGSPTTIYNIIEDGGNRTLTCKRMIPKGKTFYGLNWKCSEAAGKRGAFRLRTTSNEGVIIPGIYIFIDSEWLSKSASPLIPLYEVVPALGLIKCSVWALVTGGEGSAGFKGILVQDGY